jgi:hypothetical protein
LWLRLKRFTLRHLLTAAAVWHLVVVFTIVLAGRTQLFPYTFDEHGTGVSFAIDSRAYRIEAENMATLIRAGRVRDVAAYNSSFHVKLYALSFALTSWLVGANILAAEPLNLLYFLLILAFAFLIARESFGKRVAMLATTVVALWPSLLLHTTQLLRDALFIPSLLLLVLALVIATKRELSLRQGFLVGLFGSVGALFVWLCRGDGWEVAVLIVVFAALASLVMQLKQRRFLAGATAALAVILLSTAILPRVVPAYRRTTEQLARRATVPAISWSRTLARAALLRQKFVARHPEAGSNIDSDTRLQTTSDFISYLPRAALIGFCAPFPNMWFATGAQVGLSGRIVAGMETLVLYAFLILCAVTLWQSRKRIEVWLLFGIASIGCLALAYVVVNVSALYRMRYAYFIILIILGMKGLLSLLSPDFEYGRSR